VNEEAIAHDWAAAPYEKKISGCNKGFFGIKFAPIILCI
jgi:hypothetical protein